MAVMDRNLSFRQNSGITSASICIVSQLVPESPDLAVADRTGKLIACWAPGIENGDVNALENLGTSEHLQSATWGQAGEILPASFPTINDLDSRTNSVCRARAIFMFIFFSTALRFRMSLEMSYPNPGYPKGRGQHDRLRSGPNILSEYTVEGSK